MGLLLRESNGSMGIFMLDFDYVRALFSFSQGEGTLSFSAFSTYIKWSINWVCFSPHNSRSE